MKRERERERERERKREERESGKREFKKAISKLCFYTKKFRDYFNF